MLHSPETQSTKLPFTPVILSKSRVNWSTLRAQIQILAGYIGFSPLLESGLRSTVPLPKSEQQICVMIELVSSIQKTQRQAG